MKQSEEIRLKANNLEATIKREILSIIKDIGECGVDITVTQTWHKYPSGSKRNLTNTIVDVEIII